MNDTKKELERRALTAAMNAGGQLFPTGEILEGEAPDFRIKSTSGTVGIEVTELLPLPRNNSFNSTLAEESLHQEVVRLAEEDYFRPPDAIPVKATVYFWDVERGRNRARQMAGELSAFVAAHAQEATPLATFVRLHKLPEGFGTISILSGQEPWVAQESVTVTFDGIHHQFSERIAAKNRLVPQYRLNLPDSPIFLLIYTCAGVSRHVPPSTGTTEWCFGFDFDRVLFYSIMYGTVEEIRRA